ncbi:MAG: hypothetical protein HY787_06535 [Deltaproteobacteria bacterium]|nr:hypothetical protein [Deltaproteobacteria bacterium]
MKTIIGLLGVILFMVMAGCAARDDIVILANRTTTLERTLFQVRDAQEENKNALTRRLEQTERKIESQTQPILQNQANATAQQEALKVQIQILQGRIEALENNQKKDQLHLKEQSHLSDSVTKEMKDLQARLLRLEKPPTPPPPAADSGAKPEKSKEGAPDSKETPTEAKETDKAKETVKLSPEEIFEAAQSLLQKQAYAGAKKKYEEYFKAAPKGKYLEEARCFWKKLSRIIRNPSRPRKPGSN